MGSLCCPGRNVGTHLGNGSQATHQGFFGLVSLQTARFRGQESHIVFLYLGIFLIKIFSIERFMTEPQEGPQLKSSSTCSCPGVCTSWYCACLDRDADFEVEGTMASDHKALVKVILRPLSRDNLASGIKEKLVQMWPQGPGQRHPQATHHEISVKLVQTWPRGPGHGHPQATHQITWPVGSVWNWC